MGCKHEALSDTAFKAACQIAMSTVILCMFAQACTHDPFVDYMSSCGWGQV